MEWSNVTYSNRIVQNLHGEVKRGELAAVMGPSGSGKTYTLGILSGRRTGVRYGRNSCNRIAEICNYAVPKIQVHGVKFCSALTTGTILVDGEELDKHHVKNICLVQQKDAFFANLTLIETLNFAANLRLSRTLSREEKQRVVRNLIKLLDLESCREIKCGDGETYGLSGGERKRLNIACEMISNPDIILLDEPTSGLDASAAKKLINFLRTFAVQEHKIVICSIHQPSSCIFQCFHKLLLLHQGRQIYFGTPEGTLLCLEQKGFICPPMYNPAEYILEVLPEMTDPCGDCGAAPTTKVEQFQIDDGGKTYKSSSMESIVNEEKINNLPFLPASYKQQFITLWRRSWSHRWDQILNKYTTAEVVAICIFMSIIWFKVGTNYEDIERRKAMLYFLTQYWAFHAPYKVMFSFPSERDVVRRERASGWYSLSAYYIAKCVVEIPLICIFPVAMVTVVYWVCGMTHFMSYMYTLAVIILTVIEFNALGVAIGCTAMSYQHTLTLCAICLLMMLMFGGFYSRRLPARLAWTRYLSLFNYTWYALLIIHFNSHHYDNPIIASNDPWFDSNETMDMSGTETIIKEAGVELDLTSNIAIILISTIVFYVYGYLALRYLNKPEHEATN